MKPRNCIQIEEHATLYQYLDSMLAEAVELAAVQNEMAETDTRKAASQHADIQQRPHADMVDMDCEQQLNKPENPQPFHRDQGQYEPLLNKENNKVLIFKVNGKTMAVPTTLINGVIKWDDNIRQLPEHREFSLGIIHCHGRNTEILDTDMLMMDGYPREETADYSHIVLFHDGRYGLACQSVDTIDAFDTDKISWRETRAKRAWFAGVEKASMCLIVDINEIIRLID